MKEFESRSQEADDTAQRPQPATPTEQCNVQYHLRSTTVKQLKLKQMQLGRVVYPRRLQTEHLVVSSGGEPPFLTVLSK